MSLVIDIGQGAGLAGATGVRPFLPPLLAGALARGDIALDFEGSGWGFLESPVFLLAVFALAVVSYGAERSRPNAVMERGLGALGVALGALLFGGSLAAGGEAAWPGVVAGVACALLAFAAVGALFQRARRRLEDPSLLTVYAEALALALAAIAIFLPPVSFLAIAAFVFLLAGARREEGRKFAGLRVLR